MSYFTLDFEKPVKILEDQIQELKLASDGKGIDVSNEIKALERKTSQLTKEIYSKLSPWEQVQLSRHPNRPPNQAYLPRIFDNFYEVHGDRKFADDPAVIAGFGMLDGQRVAIIGIEKGRKTKEKLHHNFGMPRPEGYRKALRVMKLASRFSIPIITFIDTPGAYPGIGAEERGQAAAIAENIESMFSLEVPVVSIVIGEGGSGGALGLAIADKLIMLEYSIYSVISPESCASILWADPKMAETAANSLQLGALKALDLKVADEIIGEPSGGAHRDYEEISATVKKNLSRVINQLKSKSKEELISSRYNKYRALGKDSLI